MRDLAPPNASRHAGAMPTASRAVAAFALLVSLGVLGGALASEWYGGLVPCPLCLLERWPWRAAAGLCALALLLPRGGRRWTLGATALALLAGVTLAVVHVGVERGAWPSPLPECAAPRLSGSLADRLAALPERPSMACEDPVYLVPTLPVSMAELDLIATLSLAAVLAISVARGSGERHA